MNFDVIYNNCMSALMLSSLQLYSAGFIALVVLQLQYDSIFFSLILFNIFVSDLLKKTKQATLMVWH